MAQIPVTMATNTYDKRNQLIQTATSEGVSLSNSYNGEGLRVSKTVGDQTTHYLYEYDKVVLGRLNYKPTSGVDLVTTPGKTTTVLGTYAKDTGSIVNELGNVKSTNFGPKQNGFNVLNVPDELYQNPKQFWNE